MDNFLIFMSLCGGSATLVYFVVTRLFQKWISPRYQYRLLKATMFFWLFPIPYYEVWIKDFIRWIAKDNTLFLPLGEMQKGITYQVNLQKDFMLLSDGVYIPKFPWYVLIWFVAMLIAFCVILFLSLRRYHNTKVFLMDVSEETDRRKTKIPGRKVSLRKTGEPVTPCTFGFLQPVIIIPQKMEQKKEDYVIKHETVHVRSCDSLFRFLSVLILGLNFYNPFAWFLVREINWISEQACDETTLKGASKSERIAYSHILINDEKGQNEYQVLSFISPKDVMKTRMKKVVKPVRNRLPVFIFSMILMAVIGVVPVLAYQLPTISQIGTQTCEDYGNTDWATIELLDGMSEEEIKESQWQSPNEKYFREVDAYYVVEETGEVILETPEMKNAAARKTCIHTYKRVTYNQHDKNSKGGCTVKQYQCQRCNKCGDKKNIVLLNTFNYGQCPH